MLPLETKAAVTGLTSPLLVKLAGLHELAEDQYPLERMALDLRSIPKAAMTPELLDLRWGALIGTQPWEDVVSDGLLAQVWSSGRPVAALQGDSAIAKPGDVLELDPYRQRAAVRYRRGDNGNVLFATERCNSYCLMCSQPPRQVEDDWRVQHLCDLVELIDDTEPSLAISGGEPTLLGDGLATVVAKCSERLPSTHLHVLSNGRLLGSTDLANQFERIHPRLTWGIPLYGDHYALHDYVVQSEGAFAQTLRGLYALEAAKQRIEIRVVLVKPSLERLEALARFILRNLPFVEHVALMGIEPTGFAKAHHAALWADPADYSAQLQGAVNALSRRGMDVSLYNLPLCTIPESLWPFARQSISNWKNDYLDACTPCAVKHRCGGFFSWVTPQWTSRAVIPIELDLEAA
ncbi:His-Xaa-Ser system radical SAM maturase HxsC [Luteimonas sp. S4-F44]|uniref:His-Xaa-Ser system radical SAM maturase HxsC n=1 Tax=Luteimonas sp. S4-F44 TaxID=2925842 RepID=UPI001F52E662|nr:His-Xaa-Ser system radical SAM maturase HxsC [Luteimonas sp. S4-F44]UNK41362.1 His-Xaa-Ser system radical SAM maturase HxsC [Luteimonas sp. S4-F44]